MLFHRFCFSIIALLAVNVFADELTDKSSTPEISKVPGPLAMGVSVQRMGFEEVDNSNVEMALDRTTFKLPFGKFEALNQAFVPALSVERMGFRFKETQSDDAQINNTETYSIKTPLTFIKQHNDQWTRIVSITPSLHSDLEVIDEEAFSLMGLLLWKYSSSDHSTWTFGGGMNRLFGIYKPVPFFSYIYKPSSNFKVSLGFPRTGLEKRFSSKWSSFAGIEPMGGNWRYEESNNERFNVSYTSWVATTGLRYQITPSLWGTLEAGQTFERKLDLDDDHLRTKRQVDNGNIIIFSIGIHP